MSIVSINPATGITINTFEALTASGLDRKVRLAAEAFGQWKRSPFTGRSTALRRAADILDSEKERLAAIMTTEMGKTYSAAVLETEKCAWGCRYYAENGERHLERRDVPTSASRSYVAFQPLGVILAVMPWNFPFWQVFRFLAPALMAGNTGLLKHASNVPQCALAIEDVVVRAGFPPGVFQSLLVETDSVETLLQDDRIAAVSLTGSEVAGRSVGKIAGSQIKKTVLELGGSDPFIVMPSAMSDDTVMAAVKARVINNGQSCIAAKRFIVHEAIYSEFEAKFVAVMNGLVVGDPFHPATDVGPLATTKIREQLHDQVQRALSEGAKVLTGGHKLDGPGNFYQPTVLVEVKRGTPVYYEEFFGPVALLFRASGIDEAIEIANDSPFGLGASVWTDDRSEQHRFAEEIEAGSVFVNAPVVSDPRLPFGGIKRSGYGRELSEAGIREFVNMKTVWIG